MLDPRLYRAGLIAVALGLIVFAFSLQNQPTAEQATLAPDSFSAQDTVTQAQRLASAYPNRQPGSASDDALAAAVSKQLGNDGFAVSPDTYTARTAQGTKTLENVTGTRTGLESGSIVIVASRDAIGSKATAAMSGTATLLSLANVLGGETLHRTIVLASISGSVGGAGAEELVSKLPGPIDAVIVLGDMAGIHTRAPVVVPWSNGINVASPLLRQTVATALSSQTGMQAGNPRLISQFARLAFPLTISPQGVFNEHGIPAVMLSASGERGPSPGEPVSAGQESAFGRTLLASISALDSGPSVPAPSPYLVFDNKVIPWWAIRVLVLVLMLPVVMVSVDGLARANRRGYPIASSALSVLATSVPFVLAALAVVAAKLTGLLSIAPPDPVGPGTVPVHGGDIALLAGLAVLIAGSFALGRWLSPRARHATARGDGDAQEYGPATVAPAVMCALAIVIWVGNPIAALLLVPALHLWIWVADPDLRLHPVATLVLIVVGLVLPALVIVVYLTSLGFGVGGLLWAGVLMLAGGHIGVVTAIEWSVALGCTVSVIVGSVRRLRMPGAESAPVTVRGPVTYAGPGSLGGTESALKNPAVRR